MQMKKLLIIILIFWVSYKLYSSGGEPGDFNTDSEGISPNAFADQIIKKYDINEDGLLDVSKESFLRTDLGDNIMRVESRGLLFTDADAFGKQDGVVDKVELFNYLSEFDTDGDGELTNSRSIIQYISGGKSEGTRFAEKYVEKRK